MFEKLESCIEAFDKIFLILCKGKILEELLLSLADSRNGNSMDKRILLLAENRNQWDFGAGVTYCQIEEEEVRLLCRLYYMYEFSDRFQIISETAVCGRLFNLVDRKILCMDELWKALLR